MAIDFPNAPAVADIHTVGTSSWKWDGVAWTVVVSQPPTGVYAVPLGTILDWYPHKAATGPGWSVPTGFALCDGTAWTSITNDLGYGSGDGNIPDLVGKVTIGAQASLAKNTAATHTTSTGTQTKPGIGGSAGTNAGPDSGHYHNIPNHKHSIGAHKHSVGAHAHNMNHWHHTADHTHTINNKRDANSLYATITSSANGTYVPTSNTTNGASAQYTDYLWDIGTYNNKTETSNSAAFDSGDNAAFDSATTTASTVGENPLVATATSTYYPDNRQLSIGVLKIMKVLTT